MEKLEKQVRRVRGRLAMQRFLGILGWAWFAGLLAALGLMVLARFVPMKVSDWVWPAAGLGGGLLVAAVWTWIVLPKRIEAALEIDRRFDLKERVSSTLAMSAADRETEAGLALAADAARRLDRLEVAERFSVRPPRQILLALLPALAVIVIALFIRPAAANIPAPAGPADADSKQAEVKKTMESLRQKLAERRDEAGKKDLKDADELLTKLEQGAKEIQSEPKRDKALMKLNDFAKELQTRRQQLGGSEAIKKQLEQLKNVEKGPADKLAHDLARGDFKKAAEELEKLKQDLDKSKMSDAHKEEVAKQLDQIQQKLNQMADAAQAAQADLRKRADQLHQEGQEAEANKLEEQIHQLMQQAPHLQNLQQLADQLGKCSQCMKQGKGDKAGQALQQAMQKLDQLQKQAQELKTLDQAMDLVEETRKEMNCEKCGGGQCQGQGEGEGEGKDAEKGGGQGGDGDKLGKGGDGLGPGKGGWGNRPEQKTKGSFYDSQVAGKVGKGAGMVTDLVDGPNIKGRVEEQIQKESDAVQHGATDPLSGQRIPKKHSEHAREYFDRFREGK